MDDEEQRDDDADCYPDFDTPDDCQRESEEHERKVDPCSHPAVKCRLSAPGVDRGIRLTSSSIPGHPEPQP